MLTEMCLYLKNWFDFEQPKYFGIFKIENGALTSLNDGDILVPNQYYRIVGSTFNDGVYKHSGETLIDETFNGAVWLMAVPPDVVSLATEIKEWQTKYGGVESENMSPFSSESFGGYSYSKLSGGTKNSSVNSTPTWQGVYADRLARYKKI